MAVTRKPAAEKELPSSEVDAFISKGGSVAGSSPSSVTKTIPLRIKATLLSQIDTALEGQPIKIPRNTWVLQAIVEKLGREG